METQDDQYRSEEARNSSLFRGMDKLMSISVVFYRATLKKSESRKSGSTATNILALDISIDKVSSN